MILMPPTIISLVGMIGVGKTSALRMLRSMGYTILPENYIDVNRSIPCDNRLILSKWSWVADWFFKIRAYAAENLNTEIVFVDRSAIEAGLWTQNCFSLFKPIKQSFSELENLGFRFFNICLHCEKSELWRRIQQRLTLEPERIQYNECNEEFLDELYNIYTQNENQWDLTLDSTYCTTEEICDQIIEWIQGIT